MKTKVELTLATAAFLAFANTIAADTTFTKITIGDIVNDKGKAWGAAWGDFDGDGLIDLVVSNEGADFLYRNNGNGTFTSVTSSPIVANEPDAGAGVAWVDYDNDGNLDLISGGFGVPNRLFHNNGNGTFTKVEGNDLASDGAVLSVNWGDYDNDGYVDLMTTSYGGLNRLYRNNGDGSFTKMSSAAVGDMLASSGNSVAGIWSDYDNDGDLDMLVIRSDSSGNNFLYRNNGNGTFTRLLKSDIGDLGDLTSTAGGGASWGDYDNDGDLDLFLVQGDAFNTSNDALYRNNGDGTFKRMTFQEVGPLVNEHQPGSGCSWVDYDNDGWLDLFVANPGLSESGGETGRKNLLYHNNGDGTFTQVTVGDIVNDVASSNTGIWGDFDNDGFMDLFVANGGYAGGQADSLYRNNTNSNSWLKLKLIGTVSNRSAIGAKVRVKATIDGKTFWQMRELSGGDGFLSQNDTRPNFGLGDATNAAIVRIEWPSGQVQELTNVAPNQMLTIQEPPKLEGTVKVLNGQLELKVQGWKGFTYNIEASSDLSHWTRIGITQNLTGTLQAADPGTGTESQRFYRLVVP